MQLDNKLTHSSHNFDSLKEIIENFIFEFKAGEQLSYKKEVFIINSLRSSYAEVLETEELCEALGKLRQGLQCLMTTGEDSKTFKLKTKKKFHRTKVFAPSKLTRKETTFG